MSRKPTQKQINTTLTKMLYAYEALIEDPQSHIRKWHDYGDASSCLLCQLFRNTNIEPFQLNYRPDCTDCPLSLRSFIGCKDHTMHGLIYAIGQYEINYSTSLKWLRSNQKLIDNVKDAAKSRYDWLLNKISAAGYEYK